MVTRKDLCVVLRSYGGGGQSTTKFTIRNNCGGLLLQSVFLLLVLRAVIMMSAASEPVPHAPAMNFEPRIEMARTEVNLQTHRRLWAGFNSHLARLYHELEALMFNPSTSVISNRRSRSWMQPTSNIWLHLSTILIHVWARTKRLRNKRLLWTWRIRLSSIIVSLSESSQYRVSIRQIQGQMMYPLNLIMQY